MSLVANNTSTGQDCTICFESIALSDLAQLDSCEHAFHHDCIDHWFSLNHNQCPYCKKVATKLNFHHATKGQILEHSRPVDAPPQEEVELEAIFAMTRVIPSIFLTLLSSQPFFELSNRSAVRTVQVVNVNGLTHELGPGQKMRLYELHPQTRVRTMGTAGGEPLGPSIYCITRMMSDEVAARDYQSSEEDEELTPAARLVARRARRAGRDAL